MHLDIWKNLTFYIHNKRTNGTKKKEYANTSQGRIVYILFHK